MTIRVGIVSYDYSPAKGGQGRFTQALVQELIKAPDLEVHVFSPDHGPLERQSPSGILTANLAKHFGFSLSVATQLRRWKCKHRIDVFHLNGGPGGVLLLKALDTPLIYTAHHTYLQQSRHVPGQSWKRFLIGLEAAGYRNSAAVAAVSMATSCAVDEETGGTALTTVIPNGVDGELFKPLKLERQPDSVLFVGRLDSRKGADLLLRAWPTVIARKPTAELLLIGEGSLKPQLETFVREHELGRTVRFLGRVPGPELVTWYNKVSCVAVPSRFEGFGLAALEAIACGTPVVATNTDGLSEVVRPGVDGRLVKPGDEDEMAAGLLEVLAGQTPLAADVIRHTRETYSWKTAGEDYAQLYREVA
jgi:glycosyltransferase involved in cell wall biosynthesis